MASVDIRTTTGATAGSVELPDAVFGIEPNVAVMHQVVTAQLAAARAGTQSTKTRAEVRGGGAKPWKQKGTGRARQGSTRAPQWKGGGVALGPKPRSYKQRTPKKMVQLALRSALSDRAAGGNVVVVDSWGFSGPRTKDAKAALAALGVAGRVLVVLSRDDEVAYKSFRNLPDIHPILAQELNAYDVLCSDWVVFTPATLPTAPEAPAKAPGATASAAATPAASAPGTGTPVEPAGTPGTPAEAPADEADASTPPAEERPAPEGGAGE
ncbi:MAG TPA: 50S ribosomal protein L4 [Acidimicrobiales bacterium]|jgi:large subunit ribosomal protein L4|nr:50S ribosomal protein L4 [Acidimicrobiales bacterium]